MCEVGFRHISNRGALVLPTRFDTFRNSDASMEDPFQSNCSASRAAVCVQSVIGDDTFQCQLIILRDSGIKPQGWLHVGSWQLILCRILFLPRHAWLRAIRVYGSQLRIS